VVGAAAEEVTKCKCKCGKRGMGGVLGRGFSEVDDSFCCLLLPLSEEWQIADGRSQRLVVEGWLLLDD
jgi:hypothetical protein